MLQAAGAISAAMTVLTAWRAPFLPPVDATAGAPPRPGAPIFSVATEPADQDRVNKQIVRLVIRRHIDEVKACYERQLATQPTLAGRITVQMTIDSGGVVVRSALQQSSMGSPAVERCVVEAVRGWAFPRPMGGGIVLLAYPFILTPGPVDPADELGDRALLLEAGSVAPDFTAVAHNGQIVTLSKLRGTPVVLYFYPKDDTTGCTKEACEFRDRWGELKKGGVLVFGVSTQDNTSHTAFAQKYALPFPLLPDEKGELAAKYRVPVVDGKAQRITYLIGKDGRIQHVWPQVDPVGHAQDILNHLGPR